MSIVEKLTSFLPGQEPEAPVGTIHVVDAHPLNWLYVTYNTCEALTRINPDGGIVSAAMVSCAWLNNHRTLEVKIREGNHFADGEALTASTVKRSIEESMRWKAPHPLGTQFNLPGGTSCHVVDKHTFHLQFAEPDLFAVGKLRALPIMSTRFWEEMGFGYRRNGTGEGHWSMLDGPGRWGTGPFVLTEGYSVLSSDQAVIRQEPFAATWLPVRQERTPQLRLEANTEHWDRKCGPHLKNVVFRNDLPLEQALDLVCTTEGAVDLVTDIPPSEAQRVESSKHAKLVSVDSLQIVVGIINRNAEGLPLHDRRARLALNLAVDRDRIVREAMFRRADPLGGFTPPMATNFLFRLPPYPHQPERACDLWEETEGHRNRPLRIATAAKFERVARLVADNIQKALRIRADVSVIYDPKELLEQQRKLAEKKEALDWDIFIQQKEIQSADTAVLESHRAFVGETGEFRAGPVAPSFEVLYQELVAETAPLEIAQLAHRLDKYAFDGAFALFLYAPHTLYAVNKHVEFTPYRTTFELAQARVNEEHWSRRSMGRRMGSGR